MGRTCLVLAAFLFVASLQVSKSQENQGSDVILCVMQNSDKSALDRWLHCLNMSSDPMEQDEGDLGFQSNEWSNPESLALVDGDEQLVDATDTLLRSECLLKSVIKGKSGSHSIREAAGNTNGVEIARGEDVFFSWLKLNLAIMAVFRLVTSLVRKCCWNESSKPEVDALVDGGSTAVPEVVKPAIEDDISQNSPSAPADLQMLGSSLGSVVGAVFFEVLFKFSSSDEGLSIHSDDICMIMESALEEMSSKVRRP
ncbi:hypothetical protein KP509_38G046600 [Ceratopteris richardii]|uniref:Uncharacterized protein n=1 Tax=Ceratopteris richardii TaxID=49495 RepID=A0A8T2Q3Q1_CERRI|nr:hypothetical protein KP509_38G046600 [Ceratopteris richardii]